MKKCPHCAEMINDEAKVCRYCQKNVDPKVIQADGLKALGASLQSLGCLIMIIVPICLCLLVYASSLFTN